MDPLRYGSTFRLLDELLSALVAFDPLLWSGADCATLAEQLARASKACETASARAAVRASESGTVMERPVEFLARVNGSTANAARTAMEAVQAVLVAPETKDALFAGEVSLAQAAVIVSAPEHEQELLALAKARSLGPVKDAARKHHLAAIDPERLHERQVDMQRFRSWKNDLGNIAFQGELPPEVGVPFVNRLDAETDRCWRAASRDVRRRPREWHTARAFAQVVAGKGRAEGRGSGCRDRVRPQRVPTRPRCAGGGVSHRRRRTDSCVVGARPGRGRVPQSGAARRVERPHGRALRPAPASSSAKVRHSHRGTIPEDDHPRRPHPMSSHHYAPLVDSAALAGRPT